MEYMAKTSLELGFLIQFQAKPSKNTLLIPCAFIVHVISPNVLRTSINFNNKNPNNVLEIFIVSSIKFNILNL